MEGSFSQPSDRNEFDPQQIAATLAIKEPPPTEVLMKGPSRFVKKSIVISPTIKFGSTKVLELFLSLNW